MKKLVQKIRFPPLNVVLITPAILVISYLIIRLCVAGYINSGWCLIGLLFPIILPLSFFPIVFWYWRKTWGNAVDGFEHNINQISKRHKKRK